MDFEEFKKEWSNLNPKSENKIEEKQLEQFFWYMELLLEWNQKMNLTAITNPKEIILKHFIDSISIYPYVKGVKTVIDVGSGAGFPGIPLAIICPDVSFTLIDALNKRILFLKEVITRLELSNVIVEHARAEDFAKKNREKFDIATSRAVANLPVLLEYLLPFVKQQGECICMKGPHIQEGLEEAKKAIQLLGGKLEKVEYFHLVNSEIERNNILIRKVKNTPKEYPRKSGIPSKNPIH